MTLILTMIILALIAGVLFLPFIMLRIYSREAVEDKIYRGEPRDLSNQD